MLSQLRAFHTQKKLFQGQKSCHSIIIRLKNYETKNKYSCLNYN